MFLCFFKWEYCGKKTEIANGKVDLPSLSVNWGLRKSKNIATYKPHSSKEKEDEEKI